MAVTSSGVCMADTTSIQLPIDRDLAPALQSPASRDQLGQLASALLRAQLRPDAAAAAPLLEAIGRLKVHAYMHGLTDDLLAEELAAYNEEGRE